MVKGNQQNISKSAKAEQVFKLINEIKNAQHQTVKGFLILGKNLDIIQKEKLWRDYGSHLENFGMFIKELGFKHATAFNYIRIWRTFGAYKNLYELPDYYRLVKLLPVVNEENKEEWLGKAKMLTANDFNDEIQIAKGKISQEDCSHEEKEMYYNCKLCLKWFKAG